MFSLFLHVRKHTHTHTHTDLLNKLPMLLFVNSRVILFFFDFRVVLSLYIIKVKIMDSTVCRLKNILLSSLHMHGKT